MAKTPEWNRLQQHAKHVQRLHLRALLDDPVRCTALTAETDGIMLDYSRQLVSLRLRCCFAIRVWCITNPVL